MLEWAGLSSNKRALYFTSKMAKKSPSEKLPLDLQECEHVNPKTGLVEYLTALVLSFVNYKNSIFPAKCITLELICSEYVKYHIEVIMSMRS